MDRSPPSSLPSPPGRTAARHRSYRFLISSRARWSNPTDMVLMTFRLGPAKHRRPPLRQLRTDIAAPLLAQPRPGAAHPPAASSTSASMRSDRRHSSPCLPATPASSSRRGTGSSESHCCKRHLRDTAVSGAGLHPAFNIQHSAFPPTRPARRSPRRLRQDPHSLGRDPPRHEHRHRPAHGRPAAPPHGPRGARQRGGGAGRGLGRRRCERGERTGSSLR